MLYLCHIEAIPVDSLNFIGEQALLPPQVDPEALCAYLKPGLTSQLVSDPLLFSPLAVFVSLARSFRRRTYLFGFRRQSALASTCCAYVFTSTPYSHSIGT